VVLLKRHLEGLLEERNRLAAENEALKTERFNLQQSIERISSNPVGRTNAPASSVVLVELAKARSEATAAREDASR
jgi:regulator of replication initiation timing